MTQLDDTDRKILTDRLDELRGCLADYEKHGQKNMASITKDDIAWIEARLGLADPDRPLVTRPEIELSRRHESQRCAILDGILQGFDALIRNEMDYSGPRKYQAVSKICAMADKVRTYDPSSTLRWQDNLNAMIHVDGNDTIDEGMGMYRLGDGGLPPVRNVPDRAPTPVQDISRMLGDYLDTQKKLDETRRETAELDRQLDRIVSREANIMVTIDQLFRLRTDTLTLPETPARADQIAMLDRKIAEAFAELAKTPSTHTTLSTTAERPSDAPDLDHRSADPRDPDLVPAELPRGHSAGGDVRDVVRRDAHQADAAGGAGGGPALGARHQEAVDRRGPHPVVEYYQLAGPDREGGQGAGEAAQAGQDHDHGGPVP